METEEEKHKYILSGTLPQGYQNLTVKGPSVDIVAEWGFRSVVVDPVSAKVVRVVFVTRGVPEISP